MIVRITKTGKIDRRTTGGKIIAARMASARAAKKRTTIGGARVTSKGKVDKRTKEGKAICARMAKARRAKGSLKNRIKRLLF